MALINDDIFIIDDLQQQDGQITAKLMLVKDHPILLGHFPEQPVVPGACMLNLVKDVLEKALKLSLQLKNAGNIKFMQMITPGEAEGLKLSISYKQVEGGVVSVNATIFKAETACFKLQAVFA